MRKNYLGLLSGVVFAVAVMSPSPSANAASIDLLTAGGYTVLGLKGGQVTINSATSITGNVGYGENVISNTNQKVDSFIGSASVHSTATFTHTPATFAPSLGILTGVGIDAALEQADLDARARSSYYGGLSGTNLGAIGDGDNQNLTGSGGLNVYSMDSLNFKEDSITLNGSANDAFVFNVAGDFDFSSSQIVLNDGILAENVLFNFANASNININKAGTDFLGTILAVQGIVDYHNPASFVGRIIADEITLHSDFNILGTATTSPIPVPAALPLFLSGLAALGFVGHRRRRRKVA